MKTRQYLFIGLALIVLFFLGRSLFFEQVEIQDFPNESSYEYFNKDIQDLYVFRSLLENDFEEVEVFNSINDLQFQKHKPPRSEEETTHQEGYSLDENSRLSGTAE